MTVDSGAADGSRIGKIDSLRNGADGNPQWAAVISDSRFVNIPRPADDDWTARVLEQMRPAQKPWPEL